jgi:hypothetical protein
MNTDGCTPGSFTDEILLFDSISNSCDSPIVGYVLFLGLLLLIRSSIAFTQIRFWVERFYLYTKKAKGADRKSTVSGKHRRYPIIPLLSLVATMFELLFLLLTSLNIANAKNSISVLLLGMFYLPVFFDHAILIRRYVRLGNRLLPKPTATNPEKQKSLSVNDKMLNVFLFGMITMAAMVISVFLLAPAVHPGQPLLFQIMCAGVGVYQACAAFSVIWQMQRCLIAIARTKVNDKMLSDPVQNKVSIQHAIKKMRVQQLICLAIAILGIVVNLLIACQGIQLRWWVICITQFGYENGFELLSVLNMVRSVQKRNIKEKRVEDRVGNIIVQASDKYTEIHDAKAITVEVDEMDVVFASKKGFPVYENHKTEIETADSAIGQTVLME